MRDGKPYGVASIAVVGRLALGAGCVDRLLQRISTITGDADCLAAGVAYEYAD